MSMREEFEARFPVPVGVKWDEAHQNYGWVKKQSFQQTITYRALWTGWKESRASLEQRYHAERQAAERRVDELSALLRRASAFTHDLMNPISLRRDICAALNPTAEAVIHE